MGALSIFDRLETWRSNRNIKVGSYDHLQLIGYLTEEITEGIRDLSETSSVDWRVDCIVFLINSLEQDGYDAEKVMHQTIDEISSRIQDKEQMKRWALNGAGNEKWQKDKLQNPSTLIKANFKICKRVNNE